MNVERNELWWDEPARVKRVRGRMGMRVSQWINGWAALWPTRLLADILMLVLALSLFLWSGPLLRAWDATAGVLDIGILSVLPLALLVVSLARLSAAGVYQLMVESVNQLTGWQQAVCYGVLYLCYFWAAVWVVVVLV